MHHFHRHFYGTAGGAGHGPVRSGQDWRGKAGTAGVAWRGTARLGRAGQAGQDLVWSGTVWQAWIG